MNINTVILEEKGQSKRSSMSMILKVIDNQINEYKINYLANWERDHSTKIETLNDRIDALNAKKEKIEKIFDELDISNDEVDIIFSISIQPAVKTKKKNLQYTA